MREYGMEEGREVGRDKRRRRVSVNHRPLMDVPNCRPLLVCLGDQLPGTNSTSFLNGGRRQRGLYCVG